MTYNIFIIKNQKHVLDDGLQRKEQPEYNITNLKYTGTLIKIYSD